MFLVIKRYLKLLSIPLSFLILYATLNILWSVFDWPTVSELTKIVGFWFDRYGYPALFISSILEGMLLIGSYFPGVFVIFLGVVVSDTPSEAALSVAISTLGLITAHVLNYFLGKYGWYKLLVRFGMKEAIEQSKTRLERRGALAIPLSYWLPSIGALTNTSAGIIGMSLKKFFVYSALSSVVWYSIVGFIVYVSGEPALEVAGGRTANVLIYAIIGVWVAVILFLDYRQR